MFNNVVIDWFNDHLMSLIFTLIVIIVGIAVILLVKLIAYRVKGSSKTRAKALTTLIYNIIKSLIIIISIFIILAIWDFDTTLGVIIFSVIVLVVGIGAFPVLNDMYNGINNIFHNAYEIGDYIEFNNIKGKVINITLTKTQIQCVDGGIKTVANSLLRDVTNYSNEYANLFAYVKTTELSRVDEILKLIDDSLHEISEEYPNIVEGPNLNGLDSYEDGVAKIKISCKVKIEDYNKIKKGLDKYIVNLIVKNNIK